MCGANEAIRERNCLERMSRLEKNKRSGSGMGGAKEAHLAGTSRGQMSRFGDNNRNGEGKGRGEAR